MFSKKNIKKGMFDIEDFFSFIVYTSILFLILVIISTPQCSARPEQIVNSDLSQEDKLNYEQMIVEMLRTPLPDDLPALIDKQKGLKVNGFDIYRDVNYKQAENILVGNANIYKGQTYSNFIDNLEFMVPNEGDRNAIFAAVTRAVFVREDFLPHVTELQPDLKAYLTYPEIYVKYGIASRFDSLTDADLSNYLVLSTETASVLAVIPITDQDPNFKARTASVLLKIRPSGVGELKE